MELSSKFGNPRNFSSRLVYRECILCFKIKEHQPLVLLTQIHRGSVFTVEWAEGKNIEKIKLKRSELNFKLNKNKRHSKHHKTKHPEPRSLHWGNHRRDRNISFIDSGLLKLVSPWDPLNKTVYKGSQAVFNKISCGLVLAGHVSFRFRPEGKGVWILFNSTHGENS